MRLNFVCPDCGRTATIKDPYKAKIPCSCGSMMTSSGVDTTGNSTPTDEIFGYVGPPSSLMEWGLMGQDYDTLLGDKRRRFSRMQRKDNIQWLQEQIQKVGERTGGKVSLRTAMLIALQLDVSEELGKDYCESIKKKQVFGFDGQSFIVKQAKKAV